ncbi:MAG: Na+/H+ antiporter subunit E [Bacteroidales bacterium]|jgi:multicomponent Na+:H+ antiporter subunit E|nr:Na+/H+ antiporter subunit E [Bacteroidales bacterium]
MKWKNYLIMFSMLFVIWLLLNNSLEAEVMLLGLGVSLVLPLLLCGKCEVFTNLSFSPKAILYSFMFLFTFIVELFKANFDVARRVLSPSLPINPGIVEVKTKLKSKIGRVILADSITLTPGTFTLELVGDSLFIHWIDVKSTDVEESTRLIVEKFEKYLEVMYG